MVEIISTFSTLMITFVKAIAQMINQLSQAIPLPPDIALILTSFGLAFLIAKSKILSAMVWFIIFFGLIFYVLIRMSLP